MTGKLPQSVSRWAASADLAGQYRARLPNSRRPKKAGRPPQHRPGPLFPRQGSRIAEQLAHTFHLQIHERFSFGMGMGM